MRATELTELVRTVRDNHSPRHTIEGPEACQICILLVAIDTAVARHWDPISGRSLCSHDHERTARRVSTVRHNP